jgi:cytochrome P450
LQQTKAVAPGPKGPFIFRARGALRDPTGFLTNLTRTYGDVVRFRLGGHVAFVLGDPELVHFVLVERADAFRKTSLAPATGRLIGQALFASEDPVHARDRRAIQPMFSHDKLDRLLDIAVGLTQEAIAPWRPGESLDMHAAMAGLSSRMALAGVLSAQSAAEVAPFSQALDGALLAYQRTLNPFAELLERLPLRSTRTIEKCSADLERLVDERVRERRDKPGAHGDVLDLLAQMRYADGGEMSDLQLRHEALDLVIGANQVLSLALTWALYELARHPDAQGRVADEAARELGNGPPTIEHVPRLKAARAAFNEALRLHPPAWAFLRLAKAETDVGGFRVPEGSLMILSPYLLHHDARHWPNPLVFDLSRWDKGERGSRPKLAFFPFGAGPRACVGEPLATAEGTLILATILREFSLAPLEPDPVTEWALGLHAAREVPLRIGKRAETK